MLLLDSYSPTEETAIDMNEVQNPNERLRKKKVYQLHMKPMSFISIGSMNTIEGLESFIMFSDSIHIAIKFTLLNFIVWWFLVYSQNCAMMVPN